MRQSPEQLDVIATFRRQVAQFPEPRRPGGAAAAAAAAGIAAASVVAVVVGTDGSSDALAITRQATTLELRLADNPSADPQEMTRELNDAGIRGQVLVVPVAQSDAGKWVITAEVAGNRPTCTPPDTAASREETVRLSDIKNTGTVLSIPVTRVRESSGSFLLVVGRNAKPGEQPVDVSSPAVVQDEIIEPVIGRPPAYLPPC